MTAFRMFVVTLGLFLPAAAEAQDPVPPAPVEEPATPEQPEAAQGRMKAPEGARAYIIWPSDGARIKGGKFWVRMGLQNFGVAPAGVQNEKTGHHHLIVDAELPPLDEPIPNDANHLHYGGGQTEARLELPPGEHTLQLLLGDADHLPHDPPVMSERITIRVP